MPPKQSTSAASRGRPSTKANASTGGKQKPTGNQQQQKQQRRQQEESFTAPEEDVDDEQMEAEEVDDDDDDDEGQPKTIPPELLTRILHEFFEDGKTTKITKGANEAVAKYMDIFVREAIARAAVERDSGFLEVEDLEKVAPQLLLDL